MAENGAPSSPAHFPTRSQLWRGGIAGTIVEAIAHAPAPTHAACYWRGRTCLVDDEQGGFGAITFSGPDVVAAFFDHESSRSPWAPENAEGYDWRPFFAGIPSRLRALAEEALLPEMEWDVPGSGVPPAVTSAFWGEGEQMEAAEPWPAVYQNGASILKVHLMEFEPALQYWHDDYEFSAAQTDLVRRLFGRRMASPTAPIIVSPEEEKLLCERGSAGIEESRALLAAIGIVLP